MFSYQKTPTKISSIEYFKTHLARYVHKIDLPSEQFEHFDRKLRDGLSVVLLLQPDVWHLVEERRHNRDNYKKMKTIINKEVYIKYI